jgi:hypothetical protein
MSEKKSKNLIMSGNKKSAAATKENRDTNSKSQILNSKQITNDKDQMKNKHARLLRGANELVMTDGGGKNGKGGFYAKVLEEAEALDFEAAAGTEGLDDEITLLRVKIKSLLKKEPENVKLLTAATNMLAKLVKARYDMNKKQEKNLGEAIKNIIKDIGVPLGVTVLNRKL